MNSQIEPAPWKITIKVAVPRQVANLFHKIFHTPVEKVAGPNVLD